MKTILLADDSLFMRTWLKTIISHYEDIKFIEADDGLKAIDMYYHHNPDCVLMDITMPKKSGIEALQEIIKIDPKASVIMCSSLGQKSYIFDSMRFGAKDFIVKPYFYNMISILQKYL